jgi:hypothetical protein
MKSYLAWSEKLKLQLLDFLPSLHVLFIYQRPGANLFSGTAAALSTLAPGFYSLNAGLNLPRVLLQG